MPCINLSSMKLGTDEPTDFNTLRCSQCKHITHSQYHTQPRCGYNSSHGMKIHGKQIINTIPLLTPSNCPLLTDKEKKIHKASYIAQKIDKKHKKLLEAQALCISIPKEIEELKQELQRTLDSVDLSNEETLNHAN